MGYGMTSLECTYHNTITRNPVVSHPILSINLSFFLTHIKCSEIRTLHFPHNDSFFISFHFITFLCFALLFFSLLLFALNFMHSIVSVIRKIKQI